jgi:hypothetical protein
MPGFGIFAHFCVLPYNFAESLVTFLIRKVEGSDQMTRDHMEQSWLVLGHSVPSNPQPATNA